MIRHLLRPVLLTTALLGLLGLGGSAAAASGTTSKTNSLYHPRTLTHAGVEHLIAHGEQLKLSSKIAAKTEVRLYVYARALDRGGTPPINDPTLYPNFKVFISPPVEVLFKHPGTHTVTVHVNKVYDAALLKAGTIDEGYYYEGYQLLHQS